MIGNGWYIFIIVSCLFEIIVPFIIFRSSLSENAIVNCDWFHSVLLGILKIIDLLFCVHSWTGSAYQSIRSVMRLVLSFEFYFTFINLFELFFIFLNCSIYWFLFIILFANIFLTLLICFFFLYLVLIHIIFIYYCFRIIIII